MRVEDVKFAMSEARRFIAKAEAALTSNAAFTTPGRLSAATKRAALDLYKALPPLQK